MKQPRCRLNNVMWIVRIAAIVLLLAGCTDRAPRGSGDVLVLGDSVLAWNATKGASIPDVMGQALGRTVISKAVPGAQFDNGSTLAGAVGFDIQRQFPGGRWNWIVLNGGANDLSADCGCGACGATVDGLISQDGSGAVPSFITRMQRETGARVIWTGYYKGNGKGSFEGCRDDLVEMERRLAQYAAGRDGVYFVDSEDVIDPRDPAQFAPDNNHPSVKGSALIGNYLAQTIQLRSQN